MGPKSMFILKNVKFSKYFRKLRELGKSCYRPEFPTSGNLGSLNMNLWHEFKYQKFMSTLIRIHKKIQQKNRKFHFPGNFGNFDQIRNFP